MAEVTEDLKMAEDAVPPRLALEDYLVRVNTGTSLKPPTF